MSDREIVRQVLAEMEEMRLERESGYVTVFKGQSVGVTSLLVLGRRAAFLDGGR